VATNPGQNLLHYRLAEEIGAGAMGTVWRATDTTLERDVAVKILPDAFAEDPKLLARFEREARLLASLNHPSLAAVYGVHDADGTRFLAMELVPGEDLSERLERGPLRIGEVLPILCRIADAVEAAHERGVIHRDLKPANVRLTPDGRVKVLDFGLAKSVGNGAKGEGSAPDLAETQAGVVLGTVPYMSPEQARGLPVDMRSDIWSFGCVLFECLAGERPFQGETLSDLIAEILRSEPDWTKLPPDIPPSVVKVLRRCLSKDPRMRLHHIADARIELETVDAELPAGPAASPPGRGRLPSWALPAGLAAVLALLLSGLFGGFGPKAPPANPLANARFTKLTNYPGSEWDAAISRDGGTVAFVSDRDGLYEVFVGRIGTGRYRKLASGDSSDARARVRNVGFMANGNELWLAGGIMRRMRSVSLDGGPLSNFLGPKAENAAWSPSGDRLVYHAGSSGDPVYIAEGSGANPTLILDSEDGFHQHYPMWSLDGEWIYLTRGWETTGDVSLWRVRPDGSEPQQLTEDKLRVGYPTPIDDRTVLYVAQEANGAGPWLWSLDLETGASRRAALGMERYTSVAASRDGRRIVATVSDPTADLWSFPILGRTAVESDAERVELPDARALAPRSRGGDLYFLSSRGAGDGLWRLRDGEVTEIRKGSEAPLLEPVAISPDGGRIVLTHRKGAVVRLYVMNADGTGQRVLTDGVEPRGAADWSPDGEWIVVGGSAAGKNGLFKVRPDGTGLRCLVKGEALSPVWSPDGEMIVYTGKQVNAFTPLLAVTPDGQPVELPQDISVTRGGERVRFLPDGSGFVYMTGRVYSEGAKPNHDFFLLDLGTGEAPRRLTRLDDTATTRTFDISADGTRIYFDRLRDESDIVLIER